MRLALTQRLMRLVLGLCWIYQGVVPKLLFPDTGELRMVQSLGFSPAATHHVALAVGIGEILFGLLFWVLPRGGLQVAYWLNIVGLLGLGIGVLVSQPAVFSAPFNPFSLNLSMMALAAVGLLTIPDE
ncbi:DoxX-like family protein [Hymenobacter gelipurpurascens]|uniref:DoxX-like family protein n=2 Tax=Hymenobacter gelipurpurascens TaxID=89968 RepID=A0A212UAG7_9BACT|nr:DoxX-like family protein [Hymenobacter gelipurpurascens]